MHTHTHVHAGGPVVPIETTAVKLEKVVRDGTSEREVENADHFQVEEKKRVNKVGGSKQVNKRHRQKPPGKISPR